MYIAGGTVTFTKAPSITYNTATGNVDLVIKAETKAFDLKTVDRFEPKLLLAEEGAACQSRLKGTFSYIL